MLSQYCACGYSHITHWLGHPQAQFTQLNTQSVSVCPIINY